ncbi:MAG: hypothetical protein R3A79_20630 [Nannocystaceae bacterium]
MLERIGSARVSAGIGRGLVAAALLGASAPASAAGPATAATPNPEVADAAAGDAATEAAARLVASTPTSAAGPATAATPIPEVADAAAENATTEAAAHEVVIRTVPREPSSAGPDVVVRVDGGMVRGTVVAIDHGRSVSVLPAYSEGVQVIAWAEVAEVERGAVTGAAAELPEPSFGALRPWVHIERDREVATALLEITGTTYAGRYRGYTVETRCAAPCDREVDVAGRTFVISGPRTPLSRPFQIDAASEPGERVDLRVRGGRVGLLVGGVVLASFSPALVATGAVVLGVGGRGECSGADCERQRQAATIGGALLATGVALAVGGVLMALRGRTRVEQRRRGGAPP